MDQEESKQHRRTIICPDCSGDGWYVWQDKNGEPEQCQCYACNGEGKISAFFVDKTNI